MKLLLCTACGDVFNLRSGVMRQCECGMVKGKYNEDRHTAVTNGEGYCLGVNNIELRNSLGTYWGIANVEEKDYEWCREKLNVEMWIRPHEGPGNPRSIVEKEM